MPSAVPALQNIEQVPRLFRHMIAVFDHKPLPQERLHRALAVALRSGLPVMLPVKGELHAPLLGIPFFSDMELWQVQRKAKGPALAGDAQHHMRRDDRKLRKNWPKIPKLHMLEHLTAEDAVVLLESEAPETAAERLSAFFDAPVKVDWQGLLQEFEKNTPEYTAGLIASCCGAGRRA